MKLALILLVFSAGGNCLAASGPEPGLLFYLSGNHEFTADYAAGGNPEPNFLRDVKIISDGARGRGFECANSQLLSYWAPGNIYAERGTLSFAWRSRYAVGPTAFPIFRVGYADHSSWDMVWLRIDYNGQGGFDAFVTDVNLARIRVSYVMPRFPAPNEWVNLSLAWDETHGIRFYVNGKLVAEQKKQSVLYAGLDQFGPHSRTIGPMQVQSDYNFTRGGDIDEIRIYDRMLSDQNIADLSKGIAPPKIPPLVRNLNERIWKDEWWLRYGWNRNGDAPPYLQNSLTAIRKVEIHDVYDLKRWWWKANDGIRETTWPGVFNRSRLPGRNDYFQLPDWDCYSLSGKSVTFSLPSEPWNRLEISGAAWGNVYREGAREELLFRRPKDQERTFHQLKEPLRGEKIRFENAEQEEPIGELAAYYVTAGKEPAGTSQLSYTLRGGEETNPTADESIEAIRKFIAGRYTADERAILVAESKSEQSGSPHIQRPENSLPLVHVLIPATAWAHLDDGLDGIALDLPALRVKPTHGEYFPLNLQIKDPLWLQRNLLDFSFSVKPNEARTVWLDTRDRILPPGKGLYLTIAGAGDDFNAATLSGARIRLIFKTRNEALEEHDSDRFTQARDSYAMLIEEHTNNPKLNLYNRFAADITDLLRAEPNHWMAQTYWYDSNRTHPKPAFTLPPAPPGLPLWAFRQTHQLRNLNYVVNWYIDNRQIENGEFGGGLSDDGDLTNYWPATALMGYEPEKVRQSLLKELDAFYEQGMFTNGLPTIQADELHSYEEGIQVLGQSLLLDYGDPKLLERAMETSRSLLKLTGVNPAGHRHFRSSYYSGTKIAEEEPWGWSKPSSILALHPAMMLVEFNGSPQMKQMIVELADGFLAHQKPARQGRQSIAIRFADDQEAPNNRGSVLPVYWAAWKWTGDTKYLQPFRDLGPRALETIPANALDQLQVRQTWGNEILAMMKSGATNPRAGLALATVPNANSQRLNVPPPNNFALSHFSWQLTGDKHFLESLYGSQIEASVIREYMNTEGSMWIDRIDVPYSELQRARLGGVALVRNSLYPGHAVSWKFQSPSDEETTAILVPSATAQALTILVYNMRQVATQANLTTWDIEPGEWELVQGVDTDGDDVADAALKTTRLNLERTTTIELTFRPRVTTVLNLKLLQKGVPYWQRPDLGISKDDVVVRDRQISVTVHSVGAVRSGATTLALVDGTGKIHALTSLPSLEAPLDLLSRKTTVTINVPAGLDIKGCELLIDPEMKLKEITRVNNRVRM